MLDGAEPLSRLSRRSGRDYEELGSPTCPRDEPRHARRKGGAAVPQGLRGRAPSTQAELVLTVQEWVKAEDQRLVIVFEGRDAAGKGGTIKRITQYLSPRVAPRPCLLRRGASGASGTSSAT